ncbi:MAG: signal transduction protein [Thermoleophilia bacterium]|nr:signal transduction protein [Thermoleophilia bacterium]
MTTTDTPATPLEADARLDGRELPPTTPRPLPRNETTDVRRRPLPETGSSPVSTPVMAAAALAAPVLLRGVAKWRANPKHKRVRSVMTPNAVVVHDHETVAEAAVKLHACDIGALPVGSNGNLVGMITDRDIVTQVIAHGLDPRDTYVRELRIDEPVVVSGGDSVKDAAALMARHGVRRLPVIDHERLVGVISQADVAPTLGHEGAGRLLERISEAPANDLDPR